MPNQLFVFLAEAIAQAPTGFRAGDRHSLVILVSADDGSIAEERSILAAASNGWADVPILSGKPFCPDPSFEVDATTQSALEAAATDGQAIIVFTD